MSSNQSWTDCPVCGYQGASQYSDRRISYINCTICGLHDKDLEEAYSTLWGEFDDQLDDFIQRDNYQNDSDFEEAMDAKRVELIDRWADGEYGKDKCPTQALMPEFIKIADVFNILFSVTDETRDVIDLNDYDAWFEKVQGGEINAGQFFGLFEHDQLKDMFERVFPND